MCPAAACAYWCRRQARTRILPIALSSVAGPGRCSCRQGPTLPVPCAGRTGIATCSQLRLAWRAQVVDHYDNPRNVGSFNKNDEDVGTGLVGAPACGDVMKLQLRVRLVVPCPLQSAGTACATSRVYGISLGPVLCCSAG